MRRSRQYMREVLFEIRNPKSEIRNDAEFLNAINGTPSLNLKQPLVPRQQLPLCIEFIQ